MKKRFLVYTQDPGGTRYLLPVLHDLSRRGLDMVFVAHPLSLQALREGSFEPCSFLEMSDKLPMSSDDWIRFLRNNSITSVVCTLSANQYDPSNGNLIVAARHAGIPTLGFMDHWKGYDRFYGIGKEPLYFPDRIGCIDHFSYRELVKHGVPENHLKQVGHPILEKMAEGKSHKSAGLGLRVLIASQPNTIDRSFRGIFFSEWEGRRLIDDLASMIPLGPSDTLHYRPHPKEIRSDELPKGILVDNTGSPREALEKYDVFLGLDSMLLFEAALAKRKIVILDLPGFGVFLDTSIPYEYGVRIKTRAELKKVFYEDVDSADSGLSNLRKMLRGSRERCLDLILHHVNADESGRI